MGANTLPVKSEYIPVVGTTRALKSEIWKRLEPFSKIRASPPLRLQVYEGSYFLSALTFHPTFHSAAVSPTYSSFSSGSDGSCSCSEHFYWLCRYNPPGTRMGDFSLLP